MPYPSSILSFSILSFPFLSLSLRFFSLFFFSFPSFPFIFFPFLTFPFLSFPFLSFPFLFSFLFLFLFLPFRFFSYLFFPFLFFSFLWMRRQLVPCSFWTRTFTFVVNVPNVATDIHVMRMLWVCEKINCTEQNAFSRSWWQLGCLRSSLTLNKSKICHRILIRSNKMQQYAGIYFLISNFRRVLNVVCFLLGYSPACEFCADVSEHCSIFMGLWRWNSVFRNVGI